MEYPFRDDYQSLHNRVSVRSSILQPDSGAPKSNTIPRFDKTQTEEIIELSQSPQV